MNINWLFSILFSIISLGCTSQDAVLFSAGDDLHSLTLFEENQRFEIIPNGFNTFTGNFSLSGDTILLNYDQHVLARQAFDFPDSILILPNKKRVKSISGRNFCGFIYIDRRN